jgi:hypothetical protein
MYTVMWATATSEANIMRAGKLNHPYGRSGGIIVEDSTALSSISWIVDRGIENHHRAGVEPLLNPIFDPAENHRVEIKSYMHEQSARYLVLVLVQHAVR